MTPAKLVRDDVVRDWKQELVSWLAQQGVSTVLLFAIFASIWYGASALPTLVEKHLAAIRQGYNEIEESHKEERKQAEDAHVFEGQARDTRYALEREKDRILLREFLFNSPRKNGEN